MASLARIAGGIALSPFRAAGGIAKGTGRMAGAGLRGLALTAMDVTGATPLFAAAMGIKKGITAGFKKGKELLRPVGAGAVAEDSALAAIAAAASETAKIQAETDKIEAETDALTGEKVEPKTSMGGVDVEILEKIYGEVVSIRGIIGGKDPESEKKELELDEAVRHRNFLKALAALGFDGKEKKDKGPGFFGNLLEMFKKLLTGIVAGLGLAALIKFWPQLVTAFETIVDAIANINEFITDMKNFFSGAWDWLTKVPTPSVSAGSIAAAARSTMRSKYGKGGYGGKRGTPQRILTKGQDKLVKANEKVKEAKKLRQIAERKRLRLAEEAKARKLAQTKARMARMGGPAVGPAETFKAYQNRIQLEKVAAQKLRAATLAKEKLRLAEIGARKGTATGNDLKSYNKAQVEYNKRLRIAAEASNKAAAAKRDVARRARIPATAVDIAGPSEASRTFKQRMADRIKARMGGPAVGGESSAKALAAYERATSTAARDGRGRGGTAEVEARRGLRWRTSIGSWMQSKMATLGQGLAEYNLERAKAAQLANTKKFLEASRKSEMKLRKVVVRAFTGEKIMTKAQIQGTTAVKAGVNVLGGKEQANVKRIYNTGVGRTNLTLDEISRLRKAGYNVKIKPAVGLAELPKVTVHHTKTTGGKTGSFVGEGEIRANADSRFRRVHRIATAAVDANTGKKMKTSTSTAMVQEANIASKSGTAGKIKERLAGSKVRWGTRIFGTLAIGYHLAAQMGDYYVEVYLPIVAQAKVQLKTKLGREPLPNELKSNGAVKKARLELQRHFHTIGIMAATGIVVGALMAKVGSIIGAKVGALIGSMGMNPASAALGAVIGGLVGGVVFAVIGFIAGEHIAGAVVAGADKMVGGNFIPAGMDYMPDGVLNIGNWYADYLIRKEDANMEAMRRKQIAEEKLQKDQEALRESLGMGQGQGMGSEAFKVAMNLKQKSKTAEGLTDMEQVVLDEYLRKQDDMAARTAAKAKREPYLQNINRTSMMSGVDYSQTQPEKKKGFWGGLKSMLGFGDDEEDETAPQTRRVPGRTPQALNSVLGKSSLSPTAMIDADMEAGLGQVNDKSTASLDNNIQSGQAWTRDNIQPNPETIGTTLTALGKNGGHQSADVVITNINSTTNADHQTVTSTAQTSNVITFDKAPSYSPMRSRFAQ